MKWVVRVLCFCLASNVCLLALAQGGPTTYQIGDPLEYNAPPDPVPLASRSIGTQGQHSQDDFASSMCRSYWDNACACGYVQVDALFLKREPQFTNQPIIVDANTNTTLLATSGLGFNFDPGLRATVGWQLCDGRMVEFSYFGLFGGNASAVVNNPAGFLIFPGNLVGNVFVDFDRAFVNYSSRLNGFEANLLCCCGCCEPCECQACGCNDCCNNSSRLAQRCRSFTWFAGFRYLNLHEELDILVQRDILGGVENGSYRVRTNNDLYGAQLGARLRRMNGRWGWEGTAKAGIFGNAAHQEQTVTDFPNFPLRPTISSTSGQVAFLGELNLTALYRLTDLWNLRAGYTAFWIEGLALAPDQLDFNFAAAPSGDQIQTGGGMFLHGFNVGLEARW